MQEQGHSWGEKDMRAAIELFRSSGDASRMLSVIGADPNEDPVLEIQRALALTGKRVERDALEDAALAASGGVHRTASRPYVEKVMRLAREEFGTEIDRFVDFAALARALTAAAEEQLPEEAVAAVAGVEAERVIADTLVLEPGALGTTAVFFRTHCPECGGASGGQGFLEGDSSRPCECRKEVPVPLGARNGQIVVGKHTKSGQPGWFTLRLRS